MEEKGWKLIDPGSAQVWMVLSQKHQQMKIGLVIIGHQLMLVNMNVKIHLAIMMMITGIIVL